MTNAGDQRWRPTPATFAAALSLGTTGLHPTFSSPKLNVTGVHAASGDRQLFVPHARRYVEIVDV